MSVPQARFWQLDRLEEVCVQLRDSALFSTSRHGTVAQIILECLLGSQLESSPSMVFYLTHIPELDEFFSYYSWRGNSPPHVQMVQNLGGQGLEGRCKLDLGPGLGDLRGYHTNWWSET
jgi:hypothetical protein